MVNGKLSIQEVAAHRLVLTLKLQKDVEMWKARYEESNHYLDLMCEGSGIAELQELVANCDCEICGGNND